MEAAPDTIETCATRSRSPSRCAASSQESLLMILQRIQNRPAVSTMANAVKTHETAIRSWKEIADMLIE